MRRAFFTAIVVGVVGCGDTDRPKTGTPRDAGSSATRDAGANRDAGGPRDGGRADERDGGTRDSGELARDGGPRDGGPLRDGGEVAGAVPDPGNEMDHWAPNGMINIPDGHGTPETAWQVGTVTEDPWYIGGRLDAATGDAFWVFRTGPNLTQISIPLRGLGVNEIDYMHLHDGDGLVFGAEVTPDSYTVGTDGGRPAIDATWTVLPNHIYVVEVHGTTGTFF